MKTWNGFFKASSLLNASVAMRAVLATLFFTVLATGAFAPKANAQGRVGAYTLQTSFAGSGWNDISGSGTYIYSELFYYSSTSTTLPFSFNYDNTTESSGTTLYVGPGWVSFNARPEYDQYAGLGSSTYPGLIGFWGGAYTIGGSGEDPGYGGYYGVYTQVTGSAPNRVFTLQETDVHSGFGTGVADNGTYYLCSMQVKFLEGSNKIQFIYQNHGQTCDYYTQYSSFYGAAIGLNGFTSPSFTDYVWGNDLENTPNTDLQFSPPAPPQELSLTPKAINFGTHTPQNPVTMYVTVKSAGGAGSTLHITGTSLSGASAYSVVSGPANGTAIPVGSSVQYGIQFLPISNGSLTGAFTVTTDGVDSGMQSVQLFGVGAVPLVSYSATHMFRGVNTELTYTSAPHYLYVNSVGGSPLTVNNVYFIGLQASNYSIVHMPPGIIPSGGVDSIGVVFTPSLEGQPDAHMVIQTTATNIPWDTVEMDGVGILPHLSIDNLYPNPITVNFDSVKLGSDTCLQVTLSNPGSDTIAITSNYFQSADFDFSITPLSGSDTLIPPGGSQNIQICFTPLQQGYRLASLIIKTNIPHTETNPPHDTSSFVVNFVGTGVPSGKLMITGPSTNGNALIGTSACVTDTFWNTGAAPITVTNVAISGTNSADFDATLNPATPFVLAAQSHQTFKVCATPSQEGAEAALLTATANSNESPLSATLGLAVFGQSINDTGIVVTAFPANTCIGDTAVETVTITNKGNVTETYNASITTPGSNVTDFSVTPATSPAEQTGGVATFTVKFVPTTNTAETATLTIGGGEGHSIALSANGGAATIAGAGTAPLTTLNFTNTFVATVSNTGSCDWTPGMPTVTAPFAYVSGNVTSPIAPGGSVPLTFSFTPTSATPTTQTETVGFTSAVGTSLPAANVVLNGTVTTLDVKAVSETSGYSLDQNYPNPFSGTSDLSITLPADGMVNLSIINVEGQVVQTVLNQHFDAGTYGVTLKSDGLASGTYYYQMTAGGVTLTRQMVILK
jgi:hypothetical protein